MAYAADQAKFGEITTLFRHIMSARKGMEGLIQSGTKDREARQKFADLYGRYARDLDQILSKVQQYAEKHPRDQGAQGLQLGQLPRQRLI
jgi:hypothetical protein